MKKECAKGPESTSVQNAALKHTLKVQVSTLEVGLAQWV